MTQSRGRSTLPYLTIQENFFLFKFFTFVNARILSKKTLEQERLLDNNYSIFRFFFALRRAQLL